MKKAELYGSLALAIFCLAVGCSIYLILFQDGSARDPLSMEEPSRTPLDQPPELAEIIADIEGDRGQDFEPDRPPNPMESLGQVEGYVFDDESQPISGARVAILRNRGVSRYALRYKMKPLYRTKSGGDGDFSVGPLYPGTGYVVIVEHPDYAENILDNISVTPGSTTTLPPLILQHGREAHGTVTDDQDRALAGAEITIYEGFQSNSFADPEMKPARQVRTDNKGRYRVSNIKTDGFFIRATARGHESLTKRNVAAFSQSTSFQIDFRLAAEAMISGTILNEWENPVEGAVIRAFRSRMNDHVPQYAISEADGRFRVGGLGGERCRLVVSHDLYSTTIENDTAVGRSDLTIRLDRRSGISGRIADPEGGPLERFWINLKRVSTPGVPVDTGLHRKFDHEGGRFVFDRLEPGTYVLEVAARGLAATLSPAIEVQREVYADAGTIRVQAGGSLFGRVVDPGGSALSRATVTLLPSGYSPSRFDDTFGVYNDVRSGPVRTAGAGVFQITAITPGSYQIEVRHNTYPPLRLDNVRIENGQRLDLGVLTMPQGGVVEGLVFNEGGTRAPGARIRVSRKDAGFFVTVTADSRGAFRVGPIPIGTYSLLPEFPASNDANIFQLPPPSDEGAAHDVYVGAGDRRTINLWLIRKR